MLLFEMYRANYNKTGATLQVADTGKGIIFSIAPQLTYGARSKGENSTFNYEKKLKFTLSKLELYRLEKFTKICKMFNFNVNLAQQEVLLLNSEFSAKYPFINFKQQPKKILSAAINHSASKYPKQIYLNYNLEEKNFSLVVSAKNNILNISISFSELECLFQLLSNHKSILFQSDFNILNSNDVKGSIPSPELQIGSKAIINGMRLIIKDKVYIQNDNKFVYAADNIDVR